MTFRTKLLLITSLTVAGAVALATGAVSLWTRLTFERLDLERRQSLLAKFQHDLAARGDDVARRVARAAATPVALRAAAEAARPSPDYSLLLDDARTLAEAQGLDFLDLLQQDLSVISSAHAPARFGYRSDWLSTPPSQQAAGAFLSRIPLPEGSAGALAAVCPAGGGERKIYLAGAQRLDQAFLASLETAPGMRAMLWFSPTEVLDSSGPVRQAERLAPLVARVQRSGREESGVVEWRPGDEGAEAIQALPFLRDGRLLGILLVATPLREQLRLQRSILYTGLLVGASGILLGLLIGWWTTARVTSPVKLLAAGARAVAGGDWSARVPVASADEIGELAQAFNRMTAQLVEQRDRTVQAERVAAWRELARRLAHELKNPLFPLQITVENLRKARQQNSPEFDEVFHESTATLLAELANLRTIIGRFSDFAKMPVPHLEPIDVNEVVRGVVQLFTPQLAAAASPIDAVVELPAQPLEAMADREQLGRALNNLVLNAMDAMPAGGTLTIRAASGDGGGVSIQVSDTGQGLTPEECERLFTPYYTTKRHGTGLGLAIVQSVVSDHHGKIAVWSEPGRGATFTIVLPARSDL
ncbi:MAG: HAMP domain-containing protein [Candidatus Solibacter usitatus]|nr:HAMP domain-containing protein [Candidatus Solibacter usitatus]